MCFPKVFINTYYHLKRHWKTIRLYAAHLFFTINSVSCKQLLYSAQSSYHQRIIHIFGNIVFVKIKPSAYQKYQLFKQHYPFHPFDWTRYHYKLSAPVTTTWTIHLSLYLCIPLSADNNSKMGGLQKYLVPVLTLGSRYCCSQWNAWGDVSPQLH